MQVITTPRSICCEKHSSAALQKPARNKGGTLKKKCTAHVFYRLPLEKFNLSVGHANPWLAFVEHNRLERKRRRRTGLPNSREAQIQKNPIVFDRQGTINDNPQ